MRIDMCLSTDPVFHLIQHILNSFSVIADIHTEAVQAALAKHKEEKMALPMPTKRRSTYVPSPIETRTPPGRKRERSIQNVGQGTRG